MRQLKETEDQVSAAKRNILQAVTLALEEHDVQEEKIEEILHFTQMAMEKVLENYHGMPDWAMGSIGAQTGNLAALGQGCTKGLLGLASTCPFPDTLLGPPYCPWELLGFPRVSRPRGHPVACRGLANGFQRLAHL
ncbi:Sad1 and UNC84 domain containing 3 [Columba livia]|uniref:Sad1 and UNC84 domain containing 3 n=1 Tax=Columba livia TaxID=8932 RepID=A0A2I0LIL7_COLLI|nr:Sad1 and UNC84 domain containing 3 [Columba livia]